MQVLEDNSQEASASVDNAAIGIIDAALADYAHRSLVSSDEFMDILLDIRQNILSTGDQSDIDRKTTLD